MYLNKALHCVQGERITNFPDIFDSLFGPFIVVHSTHFLRENWKPKEHTGYWQLRLLTPLLDPLASWLTADSPAFIEASRPAVAIILPGSQHLFFSVNLSQDYISVTLLTAREKGRKADRQIIEILGALYTMPPDLSDVAFYCWKLFMKYNKAFPLC